MTHLNGNRNGPRARMQRMQNKRRLQPRLAEHNEVVRSIRLPKHVFERIEAQRGDVPFSTWVRNTLDEVSREPDQRYAYEILERMDKLGVTIEMLVAACRNHER